MSKDIAYSHTVCAVRDNKMDAFMQPFFVKSLGVAVRSFADEVNRKDSPMNQHPEDYELFHIGYYSEDFGMLAPLDKVVSVALATTVFAPRE